MGTDNSEEAVNTEASLIFFKSYVCPVCEKKIIVPTSRTGKARIDHTDPDLRNVHQGIDTNKYDVVVCNYCGYAALTRFFGPLAKPHRDMLEKSICSKFKPTEEITHPLSYEEALVRYKMAQLNAVCRQAKSSEKAYICLKTGWIYRGIKERLIGEDADEQKIAEAYDSEMKYLNSAKTGFLDARLTEMPPIAGMDEVTLDYLLAQLCYECEDYETGLNMIQTVVTSTMATPQQKEKARELILLLKAAMK